MPNVHVGLRNNLLWLVLDNPPLNLLTKEMIEQLTTAMQNAVKRQPRLVVITSAHEQVFCAGVDLPDSTGDVAQADALDANYQALLRASADTCAAFGKLRSQHISTVALVKGSVFRAGCELAAMCDTLIARDDAAFRLPAINAKVFPCAIATYLPAAIGHEATTRLMQSGTTLKATEAMRLGLVHQVLPSRHFLSDAEELLVMLSTVTPQK